MYFTDISLKMSIQKQTNYSIHFQGENLKSQVKIEIFENLYAASELPNS